MPSKHIVIDTGPLIALVAALGDLAILRTLYNRVLVPFEVCQEILASGPAAFAVKEFEKANWLEKWVQPLEVAPFIANSLDKGEASVIQLATNEGISTVCIDEEVGRRFARLSGLALTGTIGVLIRAKKEGAAFPMRSAIKRMEDQGVWLSEKVIAFALKEVGE